MREDAVALGIEGIEITSPSGLDDGNLLSALDLARLGAAVLREETLRTVVGRWSVTLPGLGAVESRNALLWEYPGATGVKTGFTEAAGSSLIGSAMRGGREVVTVVLASEDDRARFDDAAVLLDHAFAATDAQRIGSTLGLRVGGGVVEWTFGPAAVVVPRGATAELALPIPARPAEGEMTVAITVDGERLGALGAERTGGPAASTSHGASLGRAAVDGVYAALRTAAGGQQLG
jgi:D-alanyl-D-alanine carboxypeptidase